VQWRLASSNQAENVGTNNLDDVVLEDLMKVHEAITLKTCWNHAYIDEDVEI